MLRGFGLLVFLFGIFFGWDGHAFAATYYLATNGNDSNSCIAAQSASSAKQTFSSTKGCLAAGDTLVIRDGTYSGTSNAFSGLPNGSASGGYITIKAENEGSVIVTSGLTLDNSNQWLVFQGLRFQDTRGRVILGNHLKFFRDEFKGGCASGNCVNTQIGTNDVNTTADILLEDSWVHGTGGRYNVLIYNSNRVILRRVVVRHDGGWTDSKGDPEAAITFYNSSNSFAENVIILDSNLSYHTWQSAFYSVYNTASPQSTNNDSWLGVLSLNNLSGTDGAGLRFDGNGSQTGHQIQDAVLWDANWGMNVGYNTSVGLTATRLTIGRNSGSCTGIAGQSSGTKSISNARLFNATVSDVSVSNAVQGKPTYLPIQLGGVGANIVNRIGTSGTLYGDAGYNTDTGQVLWPFPNEARLKKEMCTDAGVTRGFCSDTSLTHYVMNYLGNGDPYSGSADTTPPTSPTNLAANATSQSSITVSWDPATDDIGVTGYQVERCTGLSCTTFTQVGTPTSSPFTDSSLTASTGYSYHVRAVDAAGNVSGWSNVVSATTQGSPTFSSCSTVTPTNFTDPTFTGYGAPYDVFASNTPLISTQCSSADTHTLTATLGIPGDTTRIVYTKGYYYDPGINDWTSFTGTCTGALNGEWCQGSVSASITDTDISTASAADPSYLVGFTCRSQNGSWKCGCRDTSCSNFYWQVQGAGM